MGFIPSKVFALLAVIVAALFACLESPFDPTVWKQPTALPKLEGALAPNERLVPTEHLHEGLLIGPEAFAEGGDGFIYTGTADGLVYRLDPDGENPTAIFFTGGVVSSAGRAVKSTTGVDYGNRLLKDCQEKARSKKLKLEDEKKCGRPLGVKFREGRLYVLDAYHGLFELDVAGGVVGDAKHLLNSLTDLPLPTHNDKLAPETALPLTFLNDFDFTEEGVVYMTDSSWKYARRENRRDIIDGGPNGRLLRFEPDTGDLRTVLCGLHFPNGVEVDQSGRHLLVVESMRFRVLEVELGRPPLSWKASWSEGRQPPPLHPLTAELHSCDEEDHLPLGVRVFAQALPGFVDNIEFDEARGGYVAAAGTLVAAPFSPLHLALKTPGIFRTIIGKIVPLEVLDKLVPSYGLLFVLGLDGSVKESMHDPAGRTAFASTAHRSSKSGYTFIGSSQNPYLGRVRL